MDSKKIVAKVTDISLTFTNSITKEVTKVLDEASFEVYEGEVFAIIGESGSGKTVLSSLLNGFLAPGGKIIGGSIKLYDIDATYFKTRNWYRYQIKKSEHIAKGDWTTTEKIKALCSLYNPTLVLQGWKHKEYDQNHSAQDHNSTDSKKNQKKMSLKRTPAPLLMREIDVTNFTKRQWTKSRIRGNIVGQVFQNPMSALTPNMKIGFQLVESLLDNKKYKTQEEAKQAIIKILQKVRINDWSYVWNKYPYELSGGMIQRVVLTLILAMRPKLVILDEPTTALDPIVQYEILDIIKSISKSSKISFIFISHDIGVIANIADRMAVMYAGRVVEYGTKEEVLYNSQHPYTWGLLNSLPSSSKDGKMTGIRGVFVSSMLQDNVDAFAFRNQYALDQDFIKKPPMFKVNDNHYAATWLLDPRAPKVDRPDFIKILREKYKHHEKQ